MKTISSVNGHKKLFPNCQVPSTQHCLSNAFVQNNFFLVCLTLEPSAEGVTRTTLTLEH